MIAKKAPKTTTNSNGKGFFDFGFMKKNKKETELEPKKTASIFEDLIEK
jgi:hypothetical protein